MHLDASGVTARGLYDLVSRFWDFQSYQHSTLAKSEGKDKNGQKITLETQQKRKSLFWWIVHSLGGRHNDCKRVIRKFFSK